MDGSGVTATGNPNKQIFQGSTKNSNECVVRCIGKIQENPDINGVTFGTSTRNCFCEIDMAKFDGRSNFKTCFLTSKSMVIFIKSVLLQKYRSRIQNLV